MRKREAMLRSSCGAGCQLVVSVGKALCQLVSVGYEASLAHRADLISADLRDRSGEFEVHLLVFSHKCPNLLRRVEAVREDTGDILVFLTNHGPRPVASLGLPRLGLGASAIAAI